MLDAEMDLYLKLSQYCRDVIWKNAFRGKGYDYQAKIMPFFCKQG